MARQVVTTTELTDDLDGSKAAGTVRFGFAGVDYEIALSKANTKAFRDTMAVYVGHGRKIARARRGSGATGAGRSKSSQDLAAVREWARANNYEVSDRGRVAGEIMDAFAAAN